MKRVLISHDVIDEIVDEESVVLCLRSETFYSFNRIGQLIWSGLRKGTDLEDTINEICLNFHAERADVERDVSEFIQRLLELGLASEASGE